MAKIEIRHDPGLTKDKLLEIFQKQFEGKYEVFPILRMMGGKDVKADVESLLQSMVKS